MEANGRARLRTMTGEQLFQLYGPTAAIIMTVVLLVVLLPTEGGSGTTGVAVGTGGVAGVGNSGGGSAGSGATGGAAGSPTGAGGSAAGSLGATGGDSGEGPAPGEPGGAPIAPTTGPTTADGQVAVVEAGADCRGDGRQVGISVWQPPCVEWTPGTNNGGATARGVTADEVRVTFNLAQLNTAEFAVGTAAGIQQSPEQVRTYVELWRRYYNNHTQTYGREVVFDYVQASGTDDAALRADVRRAAVENEAFAFIGACCNRAQLQEGGAHSLVQVTSPGQPLADDLAQNPFSITRAPTVEWVFADAGQYICNRLAGRKARWGGDPLITGSDRKFGLLFSAGAGPSGPAQGPAIPHLEQALANCGVTLAASVGISGDQSSWANEAANAIARMKSSGVTTIVFFAPILSQVFLTQAADQQAYFPEWYVGGTCCNDAVIVNRAASSTQTAHFFGTSNQFAWFKDDGSTFEAVREAVIGNDRQPLPNVGSSGSATNNAALTGTIWWPLTQAFFGCLQMAGPNLTPETWRAGCELYGTAGGYLNDFGFPTRFFTPEHPFLIQDQAEWYWDTGTTCNDEANRPGTGCTRWWGNGRRTGFRGWPNSEPDLFNPATAEPTRNMPIVWEDPGRPIARCMSCG